MYAEGDVDLPIEAEQSPALLHLRECLPRIVAKLATKQAVSHFND